MWEIAVITQYYKCEDRIMVLKGHSHICRSCNQKGADFLFQMIGFLKLAWEHVINITQATIKTIIALLFQPLINI